MLTKNNLTQLEVFFIWLKQHNLYDQYFRNFKSWNYHVDIKSQLVFDDIDRIIDVSFVWAETTEGSDFWARIHRSWVLFCDYNDIILLPKENVW